VGPAGMGDGGRGGVQDVRSKFSIGGPSLVPPPHTSTARLAALEGRAVSSARGLCLKICSVRLKPQPGVAGGQD
jgi:hypothetical protein